MHATDVCERAISLHTETNTRRPHVDMPKPKSTEQGKNNKRQVVYVLQKLIRKSVNAILYLPTLF